MSQPSPPDPERPDRDLIDFERAFGSLTPAPGRLDRDRLMYRAGRASARRGPAYRAPWPAIAAGFALVAIGEAALLVFRTEPEPRVVERVVFVPSPPPSPPAAEGPAERLASADRDVEPEPDPDPVVILRRSPRPDDRRSVAEIGWPPALSPGWLRGRDLRLGIDALPEPPPLPMASGPIGEASGRSFRSELDALLNPGESS